MQVLYAIGLMLALVLVVFLFLKVRLIIDSPRGSAELRIRPLLKAQGIIAANGEIHYLLKAPFYRKEGEVWTDILARIETDTPEELPVELKKEQVKQKERRTRSTARISDILGLFKALQKSLRVRRFQLALNMDSVIWNAWLFPVLHAYRLKGHDVQIRFFGPTILFLDVEDSLPRIAGSLIKFYSLKNRTS